ncbi:MAG: nucleotidyl transferase AbiEii/AbiGii toxin family protein [Pyrinomonadaceae bacterium]|nr:nucleotidyl transferase AbiEii/AbiGii toxin family protein [Pyrinomonadaceae bacterium]
MTNISLKTRKPIPEHIREILSAVFDASAGLEIKAFVVGAAARDLIFEYVYDAQIKRATEDIDFGIAVESWTQYERLKNALLETDKFADDVKNAQRIWWKKSGAEMKIDLVPFGGLESPAGQIAFPPEGDFVMNTVGFEEAFANSILLETDENLTGRIASLAGIALLKFVAYNDRPQARRRDVQDILFIAKNSGRGQRRSAL